MCLSVTALEFKLSSNLFHTSVKCNVFVEHERDFYYQLSY